MLDLFASVGATRFDLTLTTSAGDKDSYRRGVRPYGPSTIFIQLDDLKTEQLPKLATAAFLSLETSPGNFQAWMALAGTEDRDFARRLRKGVGADATASGATRVAGSLNFKDKYAPAFPRVAIHAGQTGRRRTSSSVWASSRRRKLCPPPLKPPVFPAEPEIGRAGEEHDVAG